MTQLSVNIDHVATLRQARGVDYPSPLDAARLAERAGASGITVHLRSDRRHIQDADVEALSTVVDGKLNLEMAATDEMVAFASGLGPNQVTLVPERPEEVTTEGGLDLVNAASPLLAAVRRLTDVGIQVSLFVDPDPAQIQRLTDFSNNLASGFEINTDHYTRPGADAAADAEFERILQAAAMGAECGLRVYAGHGLTVDNVRRVAEIPVIEELNIGHAIISRAVLVGMEAAVSEMLAAMGERP